MLPRIQRILYATDLSRNSAYALGYAVNCAKLNDAIITILYVIEIIPSNQQALLMSYIPEIPEINFEKKKKDAIYLIEKRLKIFCDKKLKDDPESLDRIDTIEICEGYPAEEIIKRSQELNYDLIVMGTHGKGIISQTFLGSVAKKVLRRNRIPVFIVPLPRGEIDLTMHDI